MIPEFSKSYYGITEIIMLHLLVVTEKLYYDC